MDIVDKNGESCAPDNQIFLSFILSDRIRREFFKRYQPIDSGQWKLRDGQQPLAEMKLLTETTFHSSSPSINLGLTMNNLNSPPSPPSSPSPRPRSCFSSPLSLTPLPRGRSPSTSEVTDCTRESSLGIEFNSGGIIGSDDSLITKVGSCSTVAIRVKENFKIKELGNIEKEKYKRFDKLVQLEQMTLGPWDPTKDKTKEFGFINPLYREYFGSDPSNMPSEQRRAVSPEALKHRLLIV